MKSNNCLILIVVATSRMLSTVYAETEDTMPLVHASYVTVYIAEQWQSLTKNNYIEAERLEICLVAYVHSGPYSTQLVQCKATTKNHDVDSCWL
eukprot:14508-Heterococcus_DN1.PRE.2